MNFDGLKDSVIKMLGGGHCHVDTGTFQNDMTTFKGRDDVLTLLVHLGYLTYDADREEVMIPNEEVRAEFARAIKQSGWNDVINAIKSSEQLMQAVLGQNEVAVAKGIDDVHMDTTSVLSYNDENSLSCVISLAFYSAKKDYILIREFPTGKGFADMVFLPRRTSNNPTLIIELKWDKSVVGALEQIRKKKYIRALENYSGEMLLVAINYDKSTKKHQCRIESYIYKK
ncbi:MAG: PD-(D/E)XK nuclease domain-containing protein [Eubacterium sp.]